MSRRPRTVQAIVAFAGAAVLAGCPVGCKPGKPKTIYALPEQPLALRKLGPCRFQVVDSVEGRRWPVSNDGFYRIELDGFTAPSDWHRFDPETRIVTVKEEWCRGDATTLALYYQALVRTVHE